MRRARPLTSLPWEPASCADELLAPCRCARGDGVPVHELLWQRHGPGARPIGRPALASSRTSSPGGGGPCVPWCGAVPLACPRRGKGPRSRPPPGLQRFQRSAEGSRAERRGTGCSHAEFPRPCRACRAARAAPCVLLCRHALVPSACYGSRKGAALGHMPPIPNPILGETVELSRRTARSERSL